MGRVDILSASAGSGKTYRLALNYITTLLEEPLSYRHILAVTFTNKATDELKGRILAQLNLLANGSKSDFDDDLRRNGYDMEQVAQKAAEARNLILHDYNNFAVMTIDKFFQRVMRAFVKEIGVDLGFNLELHTDSLLEQAADRMLEEVADDKTLHRWIMDYIGENISDGASWNIKGAIVELGKQLFGEECKHSLITSKEKPELEKLASVASAQAKVLTSAYRKEAERFMTLLGSNNLTPADFKGGERSSVATFVRKIAEGDFPNPKTNVFNALDNHEWHKAGKSSANSAIDAIESDLYDILYGIIELYPKVTIAEHNRLLILEHYRDFALLTDLQERIDDLCTEGDILPISEVSELISSLVADNDTPFIYEKSGNRYDYFMIDEFQDTSTKQWRNFVPLLRNAIAQSASSPVLLVGDVKQSIYRWRGGDWSLLSRGVEEEFEDVRREPLGINRRSSRSVVEFNNALTLHAIEAISLNLEAEIDHAQGASVLSPTLATNLKGMVREAYADYKQEVKPNASEGYVTVLSYDKKCATHPAIARIEELQQRGYRASDIAVLVRTNREARQIAAEILAYKNSPERNPRYVFDVVTQEALAINSSAAVRFVIACLTIASNPNDRLARALYNDYFARPFEEPLSAEEEEFIFSLSLLQPEEAFNEILLHFPTCATNSEVPYLQALHNQIIEFCNRNIADTALFLKWWNEKGSAESVALPQEADAITIITIHKAKGLGYNAVIVPYCSWSLRPKTGTTIWAEPNVPLSNNIKRLPISYSKTMAVSVFSHSYYTEMTLAAIDSLNTLYVAITRAKEELHLMVPSDANSSTVGAIVRDKAGVKEVGDIYEEGAPQHFESTPKKSPSLSHFATHSPAEKIAVRYSHQRYDEESKGESIAPRDYGIVMHRVMENATSREDIERQVKLCTLNGVLTAEEAESLRERIANALADPTVAEWFDSSWESVKSEREIIYNSRSWRPDRVITKGDRAVIVDYKFGLGTPANHRRQIERYADLLRRMGYKDVSGYLWYVTMERVDKVV
ncbi:MAG: UvrD-helicase domain-containing protein [Tidjanibacter sp.]|nr:UvrD-helicase domain-containing protein [Tidjanibacter sp.]